jgi:hypothetical protein
LGNDFVIRVVGAFFARSSSAKRSMHHGLYPALMHENAKARTLAPINIKVALSPLRGKLNLPAMIKNLLDTLD